MFNFDTKILHSKIDDVIKYLWFNHQSEIQATDAIIKRLDMMYKQYVLESEFSFPHKGKILYDDVLSLYTDARVYYLSWGKLRSLFSLVNKELGLNFSTKSSDVRKLRSLKLRHDNKLYLISEYNSRVGRDLLSQCISAQVNYCWVNIPNDDYISDLYFDDTDKFVLRNMYKIYYDRLLDDEDSE